MPPAVVLISCSLGSGGPHLPSAVHSRGRSLTSAFRWRCGCDMASHLGGAEDSRETSPQPAYQRNSFTIGDIRPSSLCWFVLSQMFFSGIQWETPKGLGRAMWLLSRAIPVEVLQRSTADLSVKGQLTVFFFSVSNALIFLVPCFTNISECNSLEMIKQGRNRHPPGTKCSSHWT